MEVLCAKQPEAWTLTTESLDLYPDLPPELTPVDITNGTVTAVMGRLLGGSGQDRLGLATILAPAVQGGQLVTSVDCWRLFGVDGKWAAPMVRL